MLIKKNTFRNEIQALIVYINVVILYSSLIWYRVVVCTTYAVIDENGHKQVATIPQSRALYINRGNV